MTERAQGGKRTKKEAIIEAARALHQTQFAPAEFERIRRRLIAQSGAEGDVSVDYVASTLQDAGFAVVRSTRADTGGRYEEEFHELLHFSTLDEAEVCLIRLDELLRRFQATNERAAAERVREVGRLGRRRAEMITRNRKVAPAKRAEKEEVARWFGIWLETPDAFFDWLEIRKHAPEFEQRFGAGSGPDVER
jgi:hypothetical protein